MLASIIVRTYNEVKHLPDLIRAIKSQKVDQSQIELILVDSGSTDGTLEVAKAHGFKVEFISHEEFSFGRSLNRGCAVATGRNLVFVSGHCIPMHEDWLNHLVAPLETDTVAYVYGCQRGGGKTKYSEHQLFKKYFPEQSQVPQEGYFCNNANAAIRRDVWEKFQFDETVTGLEDMELAKRLSASGHQIGYVAQAGVLHHHDETWRKVKWRYEREALALQRIMPEVHLSEIDFLRYTTSGIFLDFGSALQEGKFIKEAPGIVLFRAMQYLGAYRGNHQHRTVSRKQKEHYFFPR